MESKEEVVGESEVEKGGFYVGVFSPGQVERWRLEDKT